MVGFLLQPFLEDGDGFVHFTEGTMRQREKPAGFGMFRPEGDDLEEADGRFARPLLAGQQDAEVGVGVRVLGAHANRGTIRRFRFDHVALRPQEDAEVVVRVGVIRIQRNRPPARRDRLVQFESIAQDDPEIAVPVGPIGLQLEAAPDQRDGLVAAPLLVGEHARIVHRVRVVRHGLEDSAVHLARRHPLVALLQPDRDRDRFVQADGAVGRRSYPSLLPLMSYLKWIPASSDPSDFCGLYSRSTFAN